LSILNSLFTATSGLTAHGSAIGVIGDNIANTSTVGFKASRGEFRDVLGGFGGNAKRLGAGVRMGGIQTSHTQGSLLATGRGFDLAVRGEGFFVVQGNNGGIEGQFYTRNGQFGLDDEGYLVNSAGLRLQGYDITGAGGQSTVLSDLQIGANQSAPTPTSGVELVLNLESGAVAPTAAFDPADPDGTSNFATSATVYDSLGTERQVQMFFRSAGGGNWEWHAMVDGGELDGGTPGVLTEIASGQLAFDPNGALQSETVVASSADFLDAAPGQAIDFDFGDAIADGGTGLAGTTQFAGPSTINGLLQDGNGFGSLVDVVVGEDGTIFGAFSNGERREVGRVALATFSSVDGLDRAGDQLFAETVQSGQALVDVAGSSGRGSIAAGSLEASNVDLGGELVTLIAYQRAFQANARTVTTSDELLAEISNLKR